MINLASCTIIIIIIYYINFILLDKIKQFFMVKPRS